MMKLTSLILICLLPFCSFSGNDNYNIGGRFAGMGNTSVSISGLWSVHFNQAGLAFIDNSIVGISYENRFLMQGLGVKGLAAAIPIGAGAFGLEINSFGYTKYSENKYGLAYSRKLSDNFSAGIQMDYIQTHIAENYGSKGIFVMEAGIQAHLTDKLNIGSHIYNPTRTKLATFVVDSIHNYSEFAPTIMALGLDYTFSTKLIVALDVE